MENDKPIGYIDEKLAGYFKDPKSVLGYDDQPVEYINPGYFKQEYTGDMRRVMSDRLHYFAPINGAKLYTQSRINRLLLLVLFRSVLISIITRK